MVSKGFHIQAYCRTAVLAAACFGLTAVGFAQTADQNANQGPDPAAANSAPLNEPAAPAKASKEISDAQVEANVLSALAGAPSLADQPINTTTTYGTVTLSGTVKDAESKKLAAQLASTSVGVKKVVDSLEIGDIGTAAAQGAPDGAAPLPNNAPAASEQSAQQNPNTQQAAPQEQGEPNPPQQADMGQQPAPPPVQRRRNCPPLYTPDGRPYPPPPGCEVGNGYTGAAQYPAQGQKGGKQVTVAPGAFLQVRVSQGMDAKHTKVGDVFNGILANDVVAGGAVALPRGAAVTGTVVDAKAAGGLGGSSALALQLTSVSFGGQQYPLESAVWGVNGPSKTGQTVNNTVGLGLFGALIGAVAGGGPGAAIGAVAGGSAGMAASAATSGPQAYVPSESLLNFSLAKPITVTTVGQDELNRLASAAPGGAPGYPPPYRRRYYRPYYYPYPY
jgi:hypothetical protein